MVNGIIRHLGKLHGYTIPIVQSMWCNYRVISLDVDSIIDIWPEPGYEHGREAAGIAGAWATWRKAGAAGLLLLGCDVAADPDDLSEMRDAIRCTQEDVHTGLVKLWPRSTGRNAWIWSHRPGTLGNPAVTQDETAPVSYFSIGFAWLPARLLDLAAPVMASWQWGQTDVMLSEISLEHGITAHTVPGCRPKHLHFQEEHDGAAIKARAGQGAGR